MPSCSNKGSADIRKTVSPYPASPMDRRVASKTPSSASSCSGLCPPGGPAAECVRARPRETVADMFHEVDASLHAFLTDRLPEGTAVSFDAPPGADGRPDAPQVCLFLYHVAEDAGGRAAGWGEVRDEHHQVIKRHLPLRRYDLSYLVTALAPSVKDEHRLLGAVLAALVNYESLPTACLSSSLAAVGRPVPLRTAVLDPVAPGWKLWSALQMPPRACLDLVVTAPLLPDRPLELASPPDILDLGITPSSDPAQARPPVMPGPAASPVRRWTTVRIRERIGTRTDPDGPAPSAPPPQTDPPAPSEAPAEERGDSPWETS